MHKIDTSNWGEFPLVGANGLFRIEKGTRLRKADMREGDIRFIGATAFNNGITNRISNEGKLHPANTMTVSYNGSVGETFYQDDPFWASDDVNVLYPNFALNRHIALFLIPLIRRCGVGYEFSEKWKLEDMNRSTISLPVCCDGSPDWKYIESFMRKIEKRAIAQLEILSAICAED